MKKSKFTSLVITLVLLLFTLPSMANVRITPTDKVVYLIDVSGSMIGEGAINTIDVFQSAKNELINAINSMPDSTEIVIIPFAEKTRKPIRLFSNDNDSIISYIQNLQADGKYTDIVAAYQSALKEIDSTKTVAVFFITDGYQNKNLDTNALFQMLEYFPNSQYVTVSTMYYYLTNSRYRNMTICDVFDKSDSMYVVESLCLENANTDVIDTTISTLTNTLSAEKQNSKEFPWWIILLLLAIVVGIYLMKNIQNLPINRLSSTPSINTHQEGNINDDKKLTKSEKNRINELDQKINNGKTRSDRMDALREAREQIEDERRNGNPEKADSMYNSYSQESQQKLDQLNEKMKTPNNNENGNWTGEKGNSTYLPQKGSELYEATGGKGIEYKNGVSQNLGEHSHVTLTKEEASGVYDSCDNKQLVGRGGSHSSPQERWANLMAEKMRPMLEKKYPGMSLMDAFWKYKSDNKLLIHEDYNGQVMLIPTVINEICKHCGGIGLSTICGD